MRQMQGVLWTKGVLLNPQHLQTQNRFLESQIEFRLSSLVFCPWGFSTLEIDREALAGGMLALSSATGMFADGLPFDIPRADRVPAPKPLEDLWPADAEFLDVFLAIPEQRLGVRNVSTRAGDQNTRYVSEVVLRRDENTGDSEKPIQVARKNFRIITGAELIEGSTTLRLARVSRASTGAFQLDPGFIPPVIDTAASEYLLTITRRLVELLSAKSSNLGGMRRQRNQSLADFGISDVANFWLFYTVNSHLPLFRHLFETRRGHPAELFSAMLALAGALTTFSSNVQPGDLPAYDHSDLTRCFRRLDDLLRQLLDAVVPARHVALPLRQTEPSIHATAIDQDRYLAAPELYLAISAGMKEDELLRLAPQLMKISSGDGIDRLIRQAVRGVGMQHVAQPPSALPVKLDFHYFRLDRSGEHWDAIKLSRNLAVYVPSEFPDARLELLVMLPPDPV